MQVGRLTRRSNRRIEAIDRYTQPANKATLNMVDLSGRMQRHRDMMLTVTQISPIAPGLSYSALISTDNGVRNVRYVMSVRWEGRPCVEPAFVCKRRLNRHLGHRPLNIAPWNLKRTA